MSLKGQLQKTQEKTDEVGKVINEKKTQLQERKEEVERLRSEVVGLIEEMKRLIMNDKFRKKALKHP